MENLTFSSALYHCLNGAKISRAGWNGKNQYVMIGHNFSFVNHDGEIINVHHEQAGSSALVFVGTSGIQVGWLASQADMLASDWKTL